MGFKKVSTQSSKPTDPETLFRDLHMNTSSKIEGLWSQQADILREYYKKHLKSTDVALELPTGTGKTLIGLLIGDYRRRAFEERILYLCPTKQLAYQAKKHASQFDDLKAHVFVGSQSQYPISEYNEYESGEAIAISTYSGLFNTNPRLKDANVIILDDAHASENYIVSLWSVEINRYEHKDLFFKIISLFEDIFSSYLVESLKKESSIYVRKDSVDMIPAPTLWERLENLSSLIDENLYDSFSYSWGVIRENLAACNVFVSWHKILIRPWIPPTQTHSPFAYATQRIYMSATLGAGGELERITGIPKIDRLPVPAGWDKQGSGRRFFIFPNQSFAPTDYTPWAINRICNHNRTLVLCPDNQRASLIKDALKTCNNLDILESEDIENSLEPFITKKKAALILTNRYDGIDLPDDACRQLIILGHPDAINLQEKFLLSRLGIFSLLKDRIITRFTQATGRCTRGIRDYSLVVLVGATLHQFCLRKENQEVMHPELQAELKFGLENSKVTKIDELSENIDLFFKQGEDWKKVDQNIREIRQTCIVSKDYRSKTLMEVVKDEVDFQYYLWKGDYRHALESAQKVADKLSGDEFKGYRALWYYFVGCVAWQLSLSYPDEGFEKLVKDYLERAVNCINTSSWFSDVALPSGITISDKLSAINIHSARQIQEKITDIGLIGNTFEIKMNEIRRFIENNSPNKFEEGLTQLGNILGFLSEHPSDVAAPDSIWRITDSLLIIFEAKSDEKEDGGISANTCKQAKGHYDWAKSNISIFDKINKKMVVVVSQRKKIEKSALPFADNLYFMHISRVREIFKSIYGVYSRERSKFITYNIEEIQGKILEELVLKKLDPESLIKEIENSPLNKLPQI